MTIIQPNRYKDARRLSIILGAILVVGVLSGVAIYLQKVSAKHDLAKIKKELEVIKVENAELKTNYYALVDSDNLEQLAEELGLVQDKNPQWALAASQF